MKRKKWLFSVLMSVITVCLLFYPVMAKEFIISGKPLNLLGYFTQGGTYNLSGDTYYNESDFNSALMNLFVEADYKLTPNLKLYAAGMLTMDWMYNMKDTDKSWNNKLFDKSRKQRVDDEYWQILKEAHITWNPMPDIGTFSFRLGKQVVSWGEMDGMRIVDQINPVDGSRGPADVEFETSIIPIWLFRASFNPVDHLPGLIDSGIEFVFNPNADHIPNKDLGPGTDEFGIWAPEMYIPMGGPFPFDYMYMGSMVTDIDDPDEWESDFFEYGLRLTALTTNDWLVTLNYFYGRADTPVMKMAAMPIMGMAYDGRMIMNTVMSGRYPRQHYVGMTADKDLNFLFFKPLGGFTPVMRMEVLYQFDKTYTTNRNPWGMGEFEEFDQFRAGIGFDWKIKHRFIPHTNVAGITISPQIFYGKIMDYPSYGMFTGEEEESFAYTLFLRTTYLNSKLIPTVFWWHDHDYDADMLQLKLIYEYTHKWRFTMGANLFDGHEAGSGFECFGSKDHIFFKISYKWG